MITFNKSISSKLPLVELSIFSTMSALANQHGAINLSQGFPDFELDKELLNLVNKHVQAGANQYAPMAGEQMLRYLISKKLEQSYGIAYDENSEITITAGATQAIYTAISALVHEGDEVILFSPAYDCYAPAIEINKGKAIYCNLSSPDYKIDWEMVKNRVSSKTKMIIINSPHNPTGTICSAEDMQILEDIVKDKDIIVLSDEVYEHIIFEKQKHQSICKFPTLAAQSFAVFSFGKTFHVTGWKLGYIVGPEALMDEFRKVHQFNVFSCNKPMQLAIADYLRNENHYLGLGDFYEEKRNLFRASIAKSRFTLLPSDGTYFQLLSYQGISEKSDVDFAIELVEKHGIAAIPISVFFNDKKDEKVLRFCFAKTNETISSAGKILSSI